MPGTQNFIIFYSKQCQYSNEFLTELYKNIDLYRKFHKIDVNNTRVRIPANIREVPSIIVPGPHGKQSVYVGDDVFNWLSQVTQTLRQQSNVQSNQKNMQQSSQGNEPMSYDPQAMGGGWSDGFVSLTDESPMAKSFEFIGNVQGLVGTTMGNGMINPPPDDGILDKEKMKNEAAARQMEDLIAQRDREVPQPTVRQ